VDVWLSVNPSYYSSCSYVLRTIMLTMDMRKCGRTSSHTPAVISQPSSATVLDNSSHWFPTKTASAILKNGELEWNKLSIFYNRRGHYSLWCFYSFLDYRLQHSEYSELGEYIPDATDTNNKQPTVGCVICCCVSFTPNS